MKIAFNVKYFSPRGGGQTYLAYLAEQLLAAGHRVDAYAMEFASDFPGVTPREVRPGRWPKFLRDYVFAVKSEKALRGADYDVIFGEQKVWYLDVARPGGGVWAEYFERELRSLRGQAWRRLAKRLSLKEALATRAERRLYACPRLKRVIVNSKATKASLLDRYGLDPDRVHVVYNGVDVERFHPEQRVARRALARERFGLREDDFTLLLMARNFRLKGLEPLMEAMASLKGAGVAPVKLLAVGKRHPAAFEMKARALRVFDDIRFHGPTRDPEEFYAAADALAHPTFHDPCANVCLEAMAMGLPVITTRQNGASELMEHERSGMVIGDAWDTAALADCVLSLADADTRARMGEAARERVEPLTPLHNCALVTEVFKRVMEEATPAGRAP